MLVTTITKRMAEELSKYFDRVGIRNRYIHSDVDTLERIQILEDLRAGMFDVLVGVNLLREGLDLPEVALVAILDADKEGFLRNVRSITQIAGRAARHANGNVILYADTCTESMRYAIEQSNRRREIQVRYNMEHERLPRRAQKSGTGGQSALLAGKEGAPHMDRYPFAEERCDMAADVRGGYDAGGTKRIGATAADGAGEPRRHPRREPRRADRSCASGHGACGQVAGLPRRSEVPRPHVRTPETPRGEPPLIRQSERAAAPPGWPESRSSNLPAPDPKPQQPSAPPPIRRWKRTAATDNNRRGD